MSEIIPRVHYSHYSHHLLLYACNRPIKTEPGESWDCQNHNMCKDPESLYFAWANTADPTVLPDKTSINLDPSSHHYLVLQVHYVHELPNPDDTGLELTYQLTPTKYKAGIYLLMRDYLYPST